MCLVDRTGDEGGWLGCESDLRPSDATRAFNRDLINVDLWPSHVSIPIARPNPIHLVEFSFGMTHSIQNMIGTLATLISFDSTNTSYVTKHFPHADLKLEIKWDVTESNRPLDSTHVTRPAIKHDIGQNNN